ncbi:hypothetical protein SAMN00808754_1689 [Thermanaeromonas toyohensis ToBE]|uniref:Uncharacterized protein n=1 Tax=Thermanaeromonas toyohensis ToBE TaxID=698762 RepID=A0A1W1VUS9_9FIRM|nr:hypothetical protein [Thermanaeromonas toyohensis]SMB96851.1 hypothetical protein SAMN00808754_1689 [Thermanaeromonas toyohensis ToBE]
MSFDFWPILGYGLVVEPELLDLKKAAHLLRSYDLEPDETGIYEFMQILFDDVVPGLPPGPVHYLMYTSQGEMDDEVYLYLPPYLPWEVSEEYVRLTPEAVAQAIAGLLEPYLADGVRKEDIVARVGEIASVGGA